MIWSEIRKKIDAAAVMMNTIKVVIMVSRRVGQVTFWPSARPSCRHLMGLVLAMVALSNGVGCQTGNTPPPLGIGPTARSVRVMVQSSRLGPTGPAGALGS